MRSRSLSGALLATVVVALAPPAHAQRAPLALQLGSRVQVAASTQTGQVRFIGTAPGNPIARPSGLPPGASPAAIARAFMDRHGDAFGIRDQAHELRLTASEPASGGRSSVRFQQLQDGVAVFGGELVVNLDAGGDILSVNGEALPPNTLATTPRIDAAQAADDAVAAIARQEGVPQAALSASRPAMWIYDSRLLGGPGLARPQLVWRTEVTAQAPRQIRELVLVDARLGTIALHFNQLESALDRRVCDANESTDQVPCTAPVRVEGGPASPIADVNDAYDFSGDTYAFYSLLGRDSIDDAGMPLLSTVRACTSTECPAQNAAWTGSQMVYGTGYAHADDVVGHELTHGVTDSTSRLFYYYQSGAINESLSDVMGEFIDLTNGAGTDTAPVRWLVGEDIPGGAARNMADPTAFGDPDRTGSPNYTADLGGFDNGGVHTNSGVNNKAASLITDGGTFNGHTVTGLGITKAAMIYYEVDAHLLTSASDYADLFDLLQQACANVVGSGGIATADCDQVREAVLATEMNLPPANQAATRPVAAVCPGGPAPVDLFADDLENTGGNRWALLTGMGQNAWFYPQSSNPFGFDATYATSGIQNLWGYDQPDTADYSIAMTSGVVLPFNAFMNFSHAYGFEDNFTGTTFYDGGSVEYSTDNGASWHDAGPLITDNGYDGRLSASFDNPRAGEPAFVGESKGYTSSRLSLSSLAGSSFRVRFRITTDSFGDDYGWFIDDIRLYTCGTPTYPPPPPPTPAPAPTAAPAPLLAPAPARDTTAPGVKLTGSTRQKASNTVYVYVTATTEPLVATVTGKVSVRASAHGRTKTYKLKTSNRSIAKGAKVKIKLTIPRKTLSAMKKALKNHGKATIKFAVNTRDSAGNHASAQYRTVTFRR